MSETFMANLRERAEAVFKGLAPAHVQFKWVEREGTFKHPAPWLELHWYAIHDGKEFGAYDSVDFYQTQDAFTDDVLRTAEQLGFNCGLSLRLYDESKDEPEVALTRLPPA
jgi:hypothetical protein